MLASVFAVARGRVGIALLFTVEVPELLCAADGLATVVVGAPDIREGVAPLDRPELPGLEIALCCSGRAGGCMLRGDGA